MKKRAYLLLAIFVITLAASWLVSCRDDVFVPYPPSVIGRYEGLYTYTGVQNGRDTVIEHPIKWVFTSSTFDMDVDTTLLATPRIICDALGQYDLSSGVSLDSVNLNVKNDQCNPDLGPTDRFSLDQSDPDTMRLRQIGTDGNGNEYDKYIRLVSTTN